MLWVMVSFVFTRSQAFRFGGEAFLTQARLLRAVPLWYLTPPLIGFLFISLPTRAGETVNFVVNLVVAILVFSVATWLNRRGAYKLEEQSLSFS